MHALADESRPRNPFLHCTMSSGGYSMWEWQKSETYIESPCPPRPVKAKCMVLAHRRKCGKRSEMSHDHAISIIAQLINEFGTVWVTNSKGHSDAIHGVSGKAFFPAFMIDCDVHYLLGSLFDNSPSFCGAMCTFRWCIYPWNKGAVQCPEGRYFSAWHGKGKMQWWLIITFIHI